MISFKEYLVNKGRDVLVYIDDVVPKENYSKICRSEECLQIINKMMDNFSYTNLTEEECEILFREFIEPVSFKDIDICKVDFWYTELHNAISALFINLPKPLKDKIYQNI